MAVLPIKRAVRIEAQLYYKILMLMLVLSTSTNITTHANTHKSAECNTNKNVNGKVSKAKGTAGQWVRRRLDAVHRGGGPFEKC